MTRLKLSVDKKLKATNGWVSPDGKLYKCRYWEHDGLAELIIQRLGILGYESAVCKLEKRGWLKLQTSVSDGRSYFYRWKDVCATSVTEVTQKQFDLVFDWHCVHKSDMSYGKEFVVIN